MTTDILIGKDGRLVIPTKIRDKYGVKEGDRMSQRFWLANNVNSSYAMRQTNKDATRKRKDEKKNR